MTDSESRQVVYVTGFGPFGHHHVNTSWKVVQLLPSLFSERQSNSQLKIEQIPVDYHFVKREIPARWRQLSPLLVVHLGVSDHTREICLERAAFNSGYTSLDVCNSAPDGGVCMCDSNEDRIDTELNLELTRSACHLPVKISSDPGRYLCCYVYYISLLQDKQRAIFIHVPTERSDLTAEMMAKAVVEVIANLLEQIRSY